MKLSKIATSGIIIEDPYGGGIMYSAKGLREMAEHEPDQYKIKELENGEVELWMIIPDWMLQSVDSRFPKDYSIGVKDKKEK